MDRGGALDVVSQRDQASSPPSVEHGARLKKKEEKMNTESNTQIYEDGGETFVLRPELSITATLDTDLSTADLPTANDTRKRGQKKAQLQMSFEQAVVAIAVPQLITAGAMALRFFRLLRREKAAKEAAKKAMNEARGQLETRALELKDLEAKLQRSEEAKDKEKHNSIAAATRDLEERAKKYSQLATNLDSMTSTITVTNVELRVAKVQLNQAYEDLQASHSRLEETKGELGLTRSENELLKRELSKIKGQLVAAQQQMERYQSASTLRDNQSEGWD